MHGTNVKIILCYYSYRAFSYIQSID